MVISFINPFNDTLLGTDTLEIKGIVDVQEFIVAGGTVDITANGLEVSEDNSTWSTQIVIQASTGSSLFVRPGTANEGTLVAVEANDVP